MIIHTRIRPDGRLFFKSLVVKVRFSRYGVALPKFGMAHYLNNLGLLSLYHKDYDQAAGFFKQSLHLKQLVGNLESCAWSLEGLAVANWGLGNLTRANRLWTMVKALREKLGAPLPPSVAQFLLSSTQLADPTLSTDELKVPTMTLEQAVIYALEDF